MSNPFERLLEKNRRVQDHIVNNYFRKYDVQLAYLAFAFVFFTFGIQKPAPVESPVREPIFLFVYQFGIPLKFAINFIGLYEMTLGTLFLFKRIRLAFWMFFAHQAITLSVLFTIPYKIFEPPYIDIFGLFQLPVFYGSFSAFILKNLIFIAGFVLLTTKVFDEPEETEQETNESGDN